MLTALDQELFPKLCEVVAMPLHNQWIYLIQKNGNSSLRLQQKKDNLVVFSNEQISTLNFVDVYIRTPKDRYISGVNTYLHHINRDHPSLDIDTAFWFAKRYKFLNTHYLPQFHWIANLSQYLLPTAKIRIRDFQDFGLLTKIKDRAQVPAPTQEFINKLLENDPVLELWLYLDQILLDLAGKQLTWLEILNHYKVNYPDIIKHVLPKT